MFTTVQSGQCSSPMDTYQTHVHHSTKWTVLEPYGHSPDSCSPQYKVDSSRALWTLTRLMFTTVQSGQCSSPMDTHQTHVHHSTRWTVFEPYGHSPDSCSPQYKVDSAQALWTLTRLMFTTVQGGQCSSPMDTHQTHVHHSTKWTVLEPYGHSPDSCSPQYKVDSAQALWTLTRLMFTTVQGGQCLSPMDTHQTHVHHSTRWTVLEPYGHSPDSCSPQYKVDSARALWTLTRLMFTTVQGGQCSSPMDTHQTHVHHSTRWTVLEPYGHSPDSCSPQYKVDSAGALWTLTRLMFTTVQSGQCSSPMDIHQTHDHHSTKWTVLEPYGHSPDSCSPKYKVDSARALWTLTRLMFTTVQSGQCSSPMDTHQTHVHHSTRWTVLEPYGHSSDSCSPQYKVDSARALWTLTRLMFTTVQGGQCSSPIDTHQTHVYHSTKWTVLEPYGHSPDS
ncbi:hypothetical protein ACOMHN_065027 [Nucella lapillus]